MGATSSTLTSLALVLVGAAACAPCAAGSFVPGGITYVWWDFGIPEFETFEIDVTIHNDVGTRPGIYFQMYQCRIGKIGCYFGFQTDVFDPNQRGGRGKGILYSRWGTRDLADVRAVSAGWAQSAGYEGDFVGVRMKYEWTNHPYRFRLTPVDEDEEGVWYGLFVLDHETKREDYAGAIRFEKTAGRAPLIQNGGVTWTEVYTGVRSPAHIPYWQLSIDGCSVQPRGGRGARVKPKSARSDYARKNANSDIYFDPERNRILMKLGSDVRREHPKGRLY